MVRGLAFWILVAGLPTGDVPSEPCAVPTPESHVLAARDDPDARTAAEGVLRLFSAAYPELSFHIDWANASPGSRAFIGPAGEVCVSVFGGLISHPNVEREGLMLLVAHEVAHHLASPEGGEMACEGTADYFGAGVVMARIAGSSYERDLLRGATQVRAFLDTVSYGHAVEDVRGSCCDHPPVSCRVATFLAALDGRPVPHCAGCR